MCLSGDSKSGGAEEGEDVVAATKRALVGALSGSRVGRGSPVGDGSTSGGGAGAGGSGAERRVRVSLESEGGRRGGNVRGSRGGGGGAASAVCCDVGLATTPRCRAAPRSVAPQIPQRSRKRV